MTRLQVAVLAGGRSSEHDISRLSAVAVLDALDRDKFEPVAVLIERSGDWRLTTPERLRLTSAAPQGTLDAGEVLFGVAQRCPAEFGGCR